jgi:hypothetical protein
MRGEQLLPYFDPVPPRVLGVWIGPHFRVEVEHAPFPVEQLQFVHGATLQGVVWMQTELAPATLNPSACSSSASTCIPPEGINGRVPGRERRSLLA